MNSDTPIEAHQVLAAVYRYLNASGFSKSAAKLAKEAPFNLEEQGDSVDLVQLFELHREKQNEKKRKISIKSKIECLSPVSSWEAKGKETLESHPSKKQGQNSKAHIRKNSNFNSSISDPFSSPSETDENKRQLSILTQSIQHLGKQNLSTKHKPLNHTTHIDKNKDKDKKIR